MDLVVDTHALLWFLAGDERLSGAARAAIEQPANDVRVSVASLWEITIKHSIGKLSLARGVDGLLHDTFASGFERMGIERAHLVELNKLAFLSNPAGRPHKDPFDRLLISQALAESSTLVTKETWWNQTYSVATLW